MKSALRVLLFGALFVFTASACQAQTVSVVNYSESTISSAPTVTCGTSTNTHNCSFAEWTGAWTMPLASGDAIAVAYIGVTGPPNVTFTGGPTGGVGGYRNPAPTAVQTATGHTDTTTSNGTNYGYDIYYQDGSCPTSPALPAGSDPCSEIVYLISSDGGSTWSTWRTDPYHNAIVATPYTPQPTYAFPNGDLIRRVNGDDLKNLSVPDTAMLQVLPAPSDHLLDYGSWPANGSGANGYPGGSQVFSFEPHTCKIQISRIRPLTDGTGRYVAMGQAWLYTSGTSGTCNTSAYSDLLLVAASAADAEAGNWTLGMPYVASSTLPPNEWDNAQLASGDLLALFRTKSGSTTIREQAVLTETTPTSSACQGGLYKTGSVGCWVMGTISSFSPGPNDSGHPELAAVSTSAGLVVMEFSMYESQYTLDGGTTWHSLTNFNPTGGTKTYYYPRAVADGGGWIYVFSHGPQLLDAPYGGYSGASTPFCCIAEQIYMQKFQLSTSGGGTAPAVTTTSATSVGSSSATLNGTVNPEGEATTYYFQYGTTTSYGTSTSTQSAGSGSSAVAESAAVSSLSPSTLYHYRIVASNSTGASYGSDQTFTTASSGGGGGSSYASTILGDNPVGYWRLDESTGTTAADQTANSNTGTYSGGYTLGVSGAVSGDTAASFNGSTGRVTISDSTSLDTGDDFTAEAWVRLSSLGHNSGIISKASSYYFYVNSSNQLQLNKAGTGAATIVTSTATISDTTTWHYVVATKNGSSVHLYLDNVDVTGTVTNATIANSTGSLFLGYLASYMNGAIDEAAVYNTALSATTISNHYAAANGTLPVVTTTAATSITSGGATLNGTVNPEGQSTTYYFQYGTTTSYGSSTTTQSAGSGSSAVSESAGVTGLAAGTLYHYRITATNAGGTSYGSDQTFTTSAGSSYASTVLASGPVGYWRLDESSGTVANDQTSNNNDGTYKNGVTLGAAGAITGDTAASFASASSQNVTIPDSTSLDTGDTFTLEAWIKPANPGSEEGILSKSYSYYFYLNTSDQLVLAKAGTGAGTIVTSTSGISDTTNWHYVVATKNGSSVHLYLDGTDVTGTVSNLTIANSSGSVFVGYLAYYFNGAIDEPAIYPTALSATTVAAHYAAR